MTIDDWILEMDLEEKRRIREQRVGACACFTLFPCGWLFCVWTISLLTLPELAFLVAVSSVLLWQGKVEIFGAGLLVFLYTWVSRLALFT